MSPFCLPDNGIAGNDGKATEKKQRNAQVFHLGSYPAGQNNAKCADCSKWEL